MGRLSGITRGVANWYRGKYIAPPENDPSSSIFIISTGHYERPQLTKILGAIARFITAEWKWLLGFLVAVSGVAVGAVKLVH